MGAVTQVANRNVYERTSEVGRMLTSGQLAQAIKDAVKRQFARQEPETNIFDVLPARAATSMRYDKCARTAMVCNEGGKEEKLDLPLEDGWRKSDGNPFGVPNGAPSNKGDPDALYLYRHQNNSFNGPVGFGYGWDDGRGRVFFADGVWSGGAGVALIGGRDVIVASDNTPIVRGVEQSGAAAPVVEVPRESLAKVTDPKALLQRAEQLEAMANDFKQKFADICTAETHQRYVTEPLETAKMLREVAGKIEAAQG